MKKSEAIEMLTRHAKEAELGPFTDRVFHNMLDIVEAMFGKDSFAYSYLATREPKYASLNHFATEGIEYKQVLAYYRMRDEVVDHIRGCIDILKYKKPFRPPKKNIFSNKDNSAVILAGLGVFLVGILIGSQLSPEVVSLLERIRSIFV